MARSINEIAQEFNATGLSQQQSALLLELVAAKAAQETHLPTKVIPEDWAPTDDHRQWAFKRGKDQQWIDRIADDMRAWAMSKGEKRASWNGTFTTFMRKEMEPRSTGNGWVHAKTQRLGCG